MSGQPDTDEHNDIPHADAEVSTAGASMFAPRQPFPVNWF